MIYMACVCTIWSLYVEGPLVTSVAFIEKPVLPMWIVFMCMDRQSQTTYFLVSSSEL